MGADMTVQFLPSAEPTPERIDRLKFLVDLQTDYEVVRSSNLEHFYDDLESFKAGMRETIDEWERLEHRRDTCSIQPEGCPYWLVITGGLSWGDVPTEAYDTIERLSSVDFLYEAIREWAIEDEQARQRQYAEQRKAEQCPK